MIAIAAKKSAPKSPLNDFNKMKKIDGMPHIKIAINRGVSEDNMEVRRKKIAKRIAADVIATIINCHRNCFVVGDNNLCIMNRTRLFSIQEYEG
jgi:hypothetical protein